MSRIIRSLLVPPGPQLLRRIMMWMILSTMVITGAILTSQVEALALQTSPSALSFTGTQGAADPSTQSVTIWKRGDQERSWTASDSASWLTVSPNSGSISTERDQISVGVTLSNLAAGNYSSQVIINVVNAKGIVRKTALPVSLTVLPAPSVPNFSVSPASLTFSGTAGGTSPAGKTFTISNTGTGTLSWTASDNTPWLALSPASGTNTGTVNASVNLTGLAAGTYNTAITVTAPGAVTKTVSVALTVTAPAIPAIGLSPTSLTFTGAVGGTNPAPKPITISNSGTGTLSWTASDNTPWLALSPASGTNTGTVNASVNLTGLTAGTYNTAITVTAPDATTKTVPVALTVTAPTTPAIGLSPTSLTFTASVGGTTPAPKPVTISNSGGGTLSWTASENTAWLTLSPVSGTNSGTVNASVNLTGLAAGSHNAIITVAASGTSISPRQIPVTLNITTASTATLSWNAGTESDLAGYKVYRGTASGTYGAPLATLPKTITSHTATGLQNGTTYFFVITAYDNAGNESAYSNEVSKSIF
jgi:YbbR domain-containing protein